MRPEARHSPASRALRALLPGIVPVLESLGDHRIHRTDTYRWARGATMPNAERASLVERITSGKVPANAWTPDGKGEDGPIAEPVQRDGDAAEVA